MKANKLIKTLLIPTLGITTIVPVVIATSCGSVNYLYVMIAAKTNSTL